MLTYIQMLISRTTLGWTSTHSDTGVAALVGSRQSDRRRGRASSTSHLHLCASNIELGTRVRGRDVQGNLFRDVQQVYRRIRDAEHTISPRMRYSPAGIEAGRMKECLPKKNSVSNHTRTSWEISDLPLSAFTTSVAHSWLDGSKRPDS